jgi:hypothetical protein
LVVCTGLRDYARVTGRRRQLRTKDYTQEARDRLASAVTEARLAAGFKWRTTFAPAAGVSVRVLSALELGEPGVGQATLFAVADALPGWNADTPRVILEGGPIPVPVKREPEKPRLTPSVRQLMDIYYALIPKHGRPEAARRVIELAIRLKEDEAAVKRAIEEQPEPVA